MIKIGDFYIDLDLFIFKGVLMNDEKYDQKQQILNKYKADLELLENGRDRIVDSLTHSGLEDKIIDKKLKRLNKTIDKMHIFIEEFDKMEL